MIRELIFGAPKRLLSSVLHVCPELKIAPADIYSRLDGDVQQYGLDATERFFSESHAARALADAVSRYLDDAEGTRSLKKGYHVKLEQRARIIALRVDPPFGPVTVPEGWHPLDRRTATEIVEAGLHDEPILTPIPVRSHLLLAISPCVWGAAFLAKAVTILLRFAGRPEARSAMFVARRFLSPNVLKAFNDHVAQARAEERTDVPPLVILEDGAGSRDHVPKTVESIDVTRLSVPATTWISNIVLPGVRLFATVMWIVARSAGDARVLTLAAIAMRQAFQGLAIWRVAYNIRFKYFLDIVEYNELHILRGIIFRKFGGGVARWPTSSIDSAGSITSYLGYDIFFSPGPYQVKTYGKTWRPGCRSVSVGYLHKDPRFGSGTDVDESYRAVIEKKLAAGKRLIALFGSSDASPDCFGPPMREMLNVVREMIADRDDWFVVIKPKGFKGEYLHRMLEADSQMRDWLRNDYVISVRYDETSREVCGAGWLIERMSIGIGNAGTVMTESLTHGRPYFAYYPVFPPTPLTEKLIREGFLHRDTQSFRRAMLKAVANPGSVDVPVDWLRAKLDPYDDQGALKRVVDTLLHDDTPRGNSTEQMSLWEPACGSPAACGKKKEPANG